MKKSPGKLNEHITENQPEALKKQVERLAKLAEPILKKYFVEVPSSGVRVAKPDAGKPNAEQNAIIQESVAKGIYLKW